MLKKEIIIPLTKVEDLSALNLRRENYALKRDEQNSKVNEAITARLLRTDLKNKCEKCGKEFITKSTDEKQVLCPECNK